MIYTVTFNPSIDYIIGVDNFAKGVINRTKYEKVLPGGKGINVSIVLNNLGVYSTALGFIAGFTGNEIEKRVKKFGCLTDFINVDNGMSRINVKMKSDEETEINGQGPNISKECIDELFGKINRLSSDDILVLAGSIPNTLPDNIYEEIMKMINEKKVKVVVDATKDLLVNVLKYHPFLIKPNNIELGEIFGKKLNNNEEIIECAKKLKEMGAENVLISMAGDGAILIDSNNEVHISHAPKGKVINSVGAGDSMVAGFIAGYLVKNDYDYAFKMGICAGSASAFSENLATSSEVMDIMSKL